MERLKIANTKQTKRVQAESQKQTKSAVVDQPINFETGFETMLVNLTPEQIWQVGYECLAQRPVFERLEFTRDFVRALQEGGINVLSFFVLLGIDANDVSELTPSDFGMLLRYFKLNNRSAFELSARALMRHPEIVRAVIFQLNKTQ
jgi:hypothetical protein